MMCALYESQTPTEQSLRSRLSDNLSAVAAAGTVPIGDLQTSISNSWCIKLNSPHHSSNAIISGSGS